MKGKEYLKLMTVKEQFCVLNNLKLQNYSEKLVLNKKFNTFTDFLDLIDFGRTEQGKEYWIKKIEKYETRGIA